MFRLWPDADLLTEKKQIGCVPTLILRPSKTPPHPVSVLWIHGGGYFLGLKEMVI